MLKKRLIPMLLLSNGRMVKGKQFENFRDTGDPVSAARIYNAQFADELVFIDIDAHRQGSDFDQFLELIRKVAKECFMPLTVGGGIETYEQVKALIQAGADKVLITTAAHTQPDLINQVSQAFGRQSVIVGLEVQGTGPGYGLSSHCGQTLQNVAIADFFQDMEARGAGEFLLNVVDRDGMMQGYDIALLKQLRPLTRRPLLIAGGAGTFAHLAEAFTEGDADGVVCASIFHFGDNNPIRARSWLLNAGIPMKLIK